MLGGGVLVGFEEGGGRCRGGGGRKGGERGRG